MNINLENTINDNSKSTIEKNYDKSIKRFFNNFNTLTEEKYEPVWSMVS